MGEGTQRFRSKKRWVAGSCGSPLVCGAASSFHAQFFTCKMRMLTSKEHSIVGRASALESDTQFSTRVLPLLGPNKSSVCRILSTMASTVRPSVPPERVSP